MSRRVFLHIGAPKTGTTYLQDRLALNARSLARHGVHFPTKSPLVSPGLFHFRAALDLLGQDWGGAPGHAEGGWPALVRQVNRRKGTVVVSHEILAPASPAQVARVMRDLSGHEVHVVYSARDLARQIPAAWQESIKQGRKWSYRQFLTKVENGSPWFYRAFDLPTVLGTWGAGLPPERVHVVTVPPAGSDRDLLWRRMCGVLGIDPAWAPLDSANTNQGLGAAETQVIRKLNKRVGRVNRDPAYDDLIRRTLAEGTLAARSSRPVRLREDLFDWADAETERWREWIVGSGVDVIGSLDDLQPLRLPEGQRWNDPDRVKAKKQLRVALAALSAMTQEAASRPDPERQLVRRVRTQAQRLRRP
ncbi:hypothetical protein H5V45_11075 [Nocardioides sp. KIGAM211]|uniref:Sulfotransferase family protein n=1 Tax=Nocardioides luti TaxID=2761101 RepID=A0A7X0RIU3_9ACTN|nr:hypothetical protein [Nocardioides luti]MBB6627859.1 hypothetical protein [Nocardioides luti]